MLTSQRHLFDIPDDVAYLNCAYMSPLMKHVVEAGSSGLGRKAHPWDIVPDQFFSGLSDHPKPATEYHLKTGQRE
jgi:hypothetical protein